VVAACALGACSTGSDAQVAATTATAATPSAGHAGHASAAPVAGSALTGSAAPTSATESALRLEALLGEHSILVSDMMRARIRQDADLAQVANAAVGQNTQDMATLLAPVLGADATTQFGTLWSEHVQMLFNYSRGLATDDKAVQKSSRAELIEYETQLAEFFVAGSKGRLPRDAAAAAIKEHIDHLLAGADAYAAKQYVKSAQLYRESYGHTFDLGATLAHVLLPPAVGKQLDTPALQLRTSLTKVLGEHVALVVAAMRSAVGDRKDFAAMGDAVNGNTIDLTKAIDSLFGPGAAQGFQTRWADHVDALIAYTSATVDHDDKGQQKARLALRHFEASFGSFMNTATENRLGQKALVQAYVMHDRMLLAEIDAYAAKNFEQAHELSDQTYDDMFTVAGQLSDAIGATLAGSLPRGGSQTGGGGTAGMAGMKM
jgi:hypothetical protein